MTADLQQSGSRESVVPSEVLHVENRNGTAWVTLNRPDSLNSLNRELVDALVDYFEGLYRRPDVRVVVLAANGPAFCAGIDLKEGAFSTAEHEVSRGRVQRGYEVQRKIGDIYRAMRRCPQPIISLINGAACGGGFSLVLASDIRIAATDARMNAAYVKIGLSGCDMGASYFLPRLVGLSRASELLLTGRFVESREALSIGLVSSVVDRTELAGAGEEMAARLEAISPMGLRLTKESLGIAVDAGSLDAAMAMEDRHQILAAQTDDYREAANAFREKRMPIYADR